MVQLPGLCRLGPGIVGRRNLAVAQPRLAMVPIFSKGMSAGISHNIALERQAFLFNFLQKESHAPCISRMA